MNSSEELALAARVAKPGTRILLSPGEYRGGLSLQDLHGETDAPIVIGAENPNRRPVFVGGGSGLQLSRVSFVEVRNLVFRGGRGNGLNIDDGGSITKPSHHVFVKGITVEETPMGNNDAIKLSGLDDFRIEDCILQKWGGSGVDMVGCHRGVIAGNQFRDGGSNGVQVKGGSSEIVVEGNRFLRAGQRGVNIGGSTGEAFFSPSLTMMGAEKYEAKRITVQGNVFVEGGAPIAFVGVDGAVVRFNTFYKPERWVIRILQETRLVGFIPSRGGVFEDNLVVFRGDNWASGGVNIGDKTAPETFEFARNFWYCMDQPNHSRASLPTTEVGGVYGVDPGVSISIDGAVTVELNSSAGKVGAHAWNKRL
ncbi:MAG: right-handed parallel beta-helix repeat-containing protein [Fimbriimonadaceae bacterium]